MAVVQRKPDKFQPTTGFKPLTSGIPFEVLLPIVL